MDETLAAPSAASGRWVKLHGSCFLAGGLSRCRPLLGSPIGLATSALLTVLQSDRNVMNLWTQAVLHLRARSASESNSGDGIADSGRDSANPDPTSKPATRASSSRPPVFAGRASLLSEHPDFMAERTNWTDKVGLFSTGDRTVQLSVPDDHLRDYLESHWIEDIRHAVATVLQRTVDIELVVLPDGRPQLRPAQVSDRPAFFLDDEQSSAPSLQVSDRFGLPESESTLTGLATANSSQILGAGQGVLGFVEPRFVDDVSAVDANTNRLPFSSQDVIDPLAQRFTFDSFVVGRANEVAVSAAYQVVLNPGRSYNPLFLHGGVGIGKSHLLHAIGHAISNRPQGNANLRVRYVAAETYIDDLHSAWRSKDGGARNDVRNHYRNQIDVLLVDDIQFLQGREKVQEEFFHLFNALHHAGKQIVISCDRYPAELQQFHDRLRSRFDWGLVVEITPPDRDLRIAILRKKAQDLLQDLPLDVIYYLADHLHNNVRELEGALNKLMLHARIGNRRIDLALARSVLGPMIELPNRNLTVEVIQRVTCQHFNLKIADLKGAKRNRGVVVPRMIAMFLTRKLTQLSFPDIGRAFGDRDHSTVMHACRKIEFDLTHDLTAQSDVQAIEIVLGK